MLRKLVLTSLMLLPVAAGSAWGQEEAGLSRLRSEMPAAIEALRQRILQRSVVLTNDVTATDLTRNAVVGRLNAKVLRTPECRWCLHEIDDDDRESKNKKVISSFVNGINSRYSFKLSKAGPGKPWLIAKTSVGPWGEGGRHQSDDRVRKLVNEAVDITLFELSEQDVDPAEELFQLPGFKVTSVAPGSRAGLVAVGFESSVPGVTTETNGRVEASSGDGRATGTLVFDSGASWLPVRVEQRATFPDGSHSEFLCDRVMTLGDDAISYMTTITESDTLKSKLLRHQRREIRGRLEFVKDLPESEFTLTAYGLPEPPGVDWNARPRYYVWLAVLGIACVLLAFASRKLLRRSA